MRNNNILFSLILLVYFLTVHAITFSQESESSLPEIIVTATRTARTIEDTLASVTVFTREYIERNHAMTLPDLLKQVPGLDIVGGGGLGKVSSIFMRGTESDHTLVLIDGIKIGSATLGGTSLQDIPLAQVERIEIVRGPRSSLYGSEAIGGVIQIFTRAEEQDPHFSVALQGGNHHTYQVSSKISGNMDRIHYGITANHLRTRGFNSCNGSATEFAGCFTTEPDRDGYKNTAFTAQLSYPLNGENHLTIHGLHTQGLNEFDSSFGGNKTDFIQQILGIKGTFIISDRWESILQSSHYRDQQKNFGHNAQENDFNTQRIGFSWQNNFTLPHHQLLTMSYDYQDDRVDSTTDYTVKSRDNQSLLGEYQITWNQWTFLAGLRHDHNEQFGNQTTHHLSLGSILAPAWQMFISYGTAFKAPTFNDLYFPDFGNPDIHPEESETWEIGMTVTRPNYSGSVSVYRTLLDKMIGFDENFNAINIDQANISGMDGTLTGQIFGWEMAAQISWLRPKDSNHDHWLPRRAQKTLNYSISRQFQRIQLGSRFFTQSSRFDDMENRHRLAGYGLLDIYGEYTLTPQWTMRVSVENLFDKNYETMRFYNMPSRTFFIQWQYRTH